ncbi:MAG: response regulator [Lachnospiraceae bacterium]|nr:response regulator [Lachnospiraceae bacterium]
MNKSKEYIEGQTGIHLLMAGIVSVFGFLLVLITLVMQWELWTVPLVAMGILAIWVIHIGKLGTDAFYEYLCTGVMTIGFFYYGAHDAVLLDVSVIVCILLFMLSLLNKKSLLYLVGTMYGILLLYHLIFLGTVNIDAGMQNLARLGIGVAGTVGALLLSNTMIDRRRAEQESIRGIADQLETAKQRNADFLSNLSHELRTPINMVTGISEVALEKDMSSELRESMQSIRMAGKRLAGQINDILDYTEIFGNTLVVTNDNYMPVSVINDIITTMVMQNGGHDLELVYDLDATLPAVLVGDAEKISRVIRILLQNAIKFTEKGGVYVQVGFRRESYGVNLDIVICDTGIGITPTQLTQIYDDFYQADTGRSRSAGGLGLGIPIALGLLRAMGGFMYYSSKENQGTQIHISIPQGVADDTPGMSVNNPRQFCIVCYLRHERYSSSEVLQFYDNVVLHMAEQFGLEVYRAYQFEEQERMLHSHNVTHLFLTKGEYEENSSYYEELGKSICVVLIAAEGYVLPTGSNLILLHKPFFALPIANLLNGMAHGNDLGKSVMEDRLFVCTDVQALVVDDEEMNLMVARGILDRYHIQVDTCLSGAEAVEKCTDTPYDLIFLDHMMPGMDGVETLKRIRAIGDGIYQNLPIIALTANAISGAREMFKSEGFTEFVPKPIDRHVLERALRRVLPERNIQYYTEADKDSIISNETNAVSVKDTMSETSTVSLCDTVPAVENTTSLFDGLRRIGMNVELGLNYCYGAEDFYMEMLQMYYDQSAEKRSEIVALYESGDWAGYAIKVHALKSTSLTIGAEKLSEQAKALELAGKSGDAAYIRENHQTMLESYEAVCACIADSISTAGGGEEKAL